MAKSRIKRSLEDSARRERETGSRSEGSAVGAFIMLLIASGIAAISFFLASPDRSLDDSAMPQVRLILQ